VSSGSSALADARRRSTIAIVLMTGETAATWISSIVVKGQLIFVNGHRQRGRGQELAACY
jgi:hypothetical protein